QPRPPAEGERNIFSALRARWTRVPPEKEAVARLIEKLHQLETQVAQIGKAQGKIEAGQRQISEWIDRFEDGQRRTGDAAARRKPSVIAPALVAGLFGAAVVV